MKRFNFFKYTTLGNKVHTTYFDYWYFKKLVAGGTPAPTEPVEGEGTEFTLSPTSNKKLAVVSLKGDTTQNTLTGKNLLNIATNAWGWINSVGNVSGSNEHVNTLSDYIPVNAEANYTLSHLTAGANNIAYYDGTKTFISRVTGGNATYRTFTTPENCAFVRIWLYKEDTWSEEDIVNEKIQFETGSTPTTYEPYCGGIPSPNPDYPQDVNVVTGTQTLTITNGEDVQTYPITLGSVELCKIANYQDYIYKSGDDWFIHKNIGKLVLNGTESGWTYNSPNQVFSINLGAIFPLQTTTVPFSNYFIGQTTSSFNQALDKHISLQSSSSASSQRILIKYTDLAQESQAIKTWLGSHNTTLYYPLETPTDTEITEPTLLADLNALLSSGYLKKGTNTIKTTSTGTNLPTIIYIKSN